MARVEGSSCVQYRFKSSNEFDTLWFDGEGISLNDLKARILDQKKMVAAGRGGKTNEFDLAIANAQTGEEYSDYHVLVPRNTALIVKRVPLHRKLTLTSKRGTVELGLQGDGADDDEDAVRGLRAPAADAPASDEAAAPAAAPKTLTELQPGVAMLFYCPLCGQLLRSASIASCCASTFCDECIRQQLESGGACPSCGVPSASIELVPNVQMRTVVGKHAELHPEELTPLVSRSLGGTGPSLEDAAEAAMRSMMQAQMQQEAGGATWGALPGMPGPGGRGGEAANGGSAEQQAAMLMMQQQWAMMAMQAGMMPQGFMGAAPGSMAASSNARGGRRDRRFA